ncbi:MAG: heme exporter protein CcmD [Phenylobacterium zucineum]|nr:MAG: heme exporter protein CcmD [Phenylobacterium zucineum]
MPDLDFGKYGGFIGAAYGISVVVFAVMIIASLRFSARWRAQAEKLKAEEDAIS